VIRHVPEFEKRWNRFARFVNTSSRVDETYIKVQGKWNYLYRAVDKHGKTGAGIRGTSWFGIEDIGPGGRFASSSRAASGADRSGVHIRLHREYTADCERVLATLLRGLGP
jgi:DDE domain